jgi:hypothetical protein
VLLSELNTTAVLNTSLPSSFVSLNILLETMGLTSTLEVGQLNKGGVTIGLNALATTSLLNTAGVVPGEVKITAGSFNLATLLENSQIKTGTLVNLTPLSTTVQIENTGVVPGEKQIELAQLETGVNLLGSTPLSQTGIALNALNMSAGLEGTQAVGGAISVLLQAIVLTSALRNVKAVSGQIFLEKERGIFKGMWKGMRT